MTRYHDQWRDGRLVERGERDCSQRWELIASALAGVEPFTLLDVGAYTGYFTARATETFDCHATAVDNNPGLADLAGPSVDVIGRRLSVDELWHLPRHDVVFALSVLHHFADWQAAFEALRACRRTLIIETPDPAENWMRHAAARDQLEELHDSAAAEGELLGTTERFARGVAYQRPIYLIAGTVQQHSGEVFAGSGSCSRNMPRYDEGLGRVLGYEPFPGSLNVRLPAPVDLGPPLIEWVGRKSRDRQLWRAWIEDLPCHAMIPGARGHGPNTLEMVAPIKLRDRYTLTDGAPIVIDIEHR